MSECKLKKKFQDLLAAFVQGLERIYPDNLLSVILYGSAASGEFREEHSNLNILVILQNSDWEDFKRVSPFINQHRFRMIRPLFLSEEYIRSSSDVFPIEFLDMKENYKVLTGKDVLKDVSIDTKNLRFQCEQELKAKLISLKHLYLRIKKDKLALKNLLFKSFTSVMHILRNVIRLKGKTPPYLKQDILKAVALEFQIDLDAWQKIFAAKNKQIKLRGIESEQLFTALVRDLEKIAHLIDRL